MPDTLLQTLSYVFAALVGGGIWTFLSRRLDRPKISADASNVSVETAGSVIGMLRSELDRVVAKCEALEIRYEELIVLYTEQGKEIDALRKECNDLRTENTALKEQLNRA